MDRQEHRRGGEADILSLAREVCAPRPRRSPPRIAARRELPEGRGAARRCRGKTIVAGVGKSGLIGQKIAATLTSTGTPAVFLHPADALHGDAGLFGRGDAALFLSKSGATEELLALLPYVERHGIPLIAIVCSRARRSSSAPTPPSCWARSPRPAPWTSRRRRA
jgi:hypothetical protein